MIKHDRDPGNPVNSDRLNLLDISHILQRRDGLSNLK